MSAPDPPLAQTGRTRSPSAPDCDLRRAGLPARQRPVVGIVAPRHARCSHRRCARRCQAMRFCCAGQLTARPLLSTVAAAFGIARRRPQLWPGCNSSTYGPMGPCDTPPCAGAHSRQGRLCSRRRSRHVCVDMAPTSQSRTAGGGDPLRGLTRCMRPSLCSGRPRRGTKGISLDLRRPGARRSCQLMPASTCGLKLPHLTLERGAWTSPRCTGQPAPHRAALTFRHTGRMRAAGLRDLQAMRLHAPDRRPRRSPAAHDYPLVLFGRVVRSLCISPHGNATVARERSGRRDACLPPRRVAPARPAGGRAQHRRRVRERTGSADLHAPSKYSAADGVVFPGGHAGRSARICRAIDREDLLAMSALPTTPRASAPRVARSTSLQTEARLPFAEWRAARPRTAYPRVFDCRCSRPHSRQRRLHRLARRLRHRAFTAAVPRFVGREGVAAGARGRDTGAQADLYGEWPGRGAARSAACAQ